jgi:hypothetical protein
MFVDTKPCKENVEVVEQRDVVDLSSTATGSACLCYL